MQVKSYILENDTKKLSNYNSILFYGVNLGLKKHFKESLKALHNKDLILNYDQEDLIKSEEKLINEISMSSLFQEQKLIFIDKSIDSSILVVHVSLTKSKDLSKASFSLTFFFSINLYLFDLFFIP